MGGLFVVGLYLGDFLLYNLYVTFCIFKHALCLYKEDFLRHLVSLCDGNSPGLRKNSISLMIICIIFF